jgi:predicted permease
MYSASWVHLRAGIVAGLVCPLSGLAFGVIAAYILPLDEFQAKNLILFSALPPAVLNFLMSEQYRQQPEMVASMVLIGNAMSVLILTVVLWWLL